MKYCRNTTNLAAHPKSQHALIYTRSGLTHEPIPRQKRKNSFSTVSDSGTSNMPGQQSILNSFSIQTKLATTSKRARDITESIGYFIAKDMRPINIVEGTGFHHMIECLEPRYHLPRRKTASTKRSLLNPENVNMLCFIIIYF